MQQMEDIKVFVEEVEPSTAVYNVVRGCFVRLSAERRGMDGSPELQLLVNCGDYLQLWEPVDGFLELKQTFYLFERIEHMDLVPASMGLFGPDSTDTVLLFTFDGRCALFRLHLQAPSDQLAPGTSAPSTPGPFVLTEVGCLVLPVPALRDGLMPKRLGGVCSSGVAPVSKQVAMTSSARAVVVAAIHMGMLHVVTLHAMVTTSKVGHAGHGGTKGPATSAPSGSSAGGDDGKNWDGGGGEPVMFCAVVLIQDTPLYGMPPGDDELEVMAHMSHVYGMCFMPPPERDAYEPPLLVVLHKLERSGGLSFTLDCLALELQFGGKRGGNGAAAKGGAGRVTAAAAAAGGSSGKGAGGSSKDVHSGAGGPSVSGTAGGSNTTASAAVSAASKAAVAADPAAGSGPRPVATDDTAPMRATLITGPWVVRFLHPTTTVITPFPGVPAAGLPAGVLAISSVGVTLYSRPPTLGAIALAAATAQAEARRAAEANPGPPLGDFSGLDPFDDEAVGALFDRWFGKDFLEDAAIEFAETAIQQVDLVQYALAGMPLCAEALAPGVLLIGDSGAGLTLLHAAGSQAWAAQVLPALVGPPPFPCPAMPKVVGYLPTAAVGGGGGEGTALVSEKAGSAQEPDGLLFLGSDCSNSQIWLVPAAHIAATAKPPPAPPAPPPPPPPPPPAPVTSTSAAPGSSQDSPAPKAGAADGKEEAQQPQAMQTEDVLLPPPLPVLHWPVSELAAIKSLAPVTDIAVVPDSSGADDPWLIASCGRNAAGRLVRARLAAGLQAYLSDGPKVPDGCRMFPLRLGTNFFEDDEQQGASSPGPGLGHTHIAFSFEAVDRTDLLSVAGAGHGGAGGSEFTQVELPGLDHGAASLLVVDVAGRRLVQVTPASVRVLEPLFSGGGLAVEWHAPEPLSLAAHSGSILAAASPTRLHLLRIDPGTGSVTALSNVKQLQAQLSALALYRLPPPPRPPPGPGQRRPPSSSESQVSEPEATYILMGQWLSNRVEVAAVADPARNLLELQLGEDETPRSLTMLDLSPAAGGRATAAAAALPPVLLAGTNTGQLLMWQLVEGPLAARPWRLGPCYSLRVGQVAVGLHPVPLSRPDRPRSGGGGGGYVYVHSHSGALVRPRQQAAAVAAAAAAAGQPSLEQSLEVIRVHGSEGLQALCHVSTTAMPDSTCWVTREGQLLFGRIDPRVKLRWSTAFVGETIHSFAYHAPSHCLVALCESHPIGDNSLRVIEVNSLHQVMSMRLAYGHYHTAITAGPLPCTSGVKAAARRAATMAAKRSGEASTTVAGPTVPEKEFVVLGSYLSVDSSCDPEVGKHVHGAELQYGAVSFLELVANPASDGSNATQYQLLLQGICLVPSVPTSLAIARPSLYAAPDSGTGSGGATDPGGAGSHLRAGTAALTEAAEMEAGGGGGSSRGSGSDPVDMPYLLMGCQGGVRLYRVYVDDGHREGDKAVKRALKLVGQVDELNLPYPKNYTEVQAALEALDKEIKKRAEEEAKEAEAAAKAAAAQGDGAVGMVEGGGAEGGGGKDGGGGGEEDEGLAEDESELPEVEVNWEERLKALAEEEAAENIEWKYGLGLMEQPDSDDEEYFRKWAQERGLEKPPPEAALAVKLLRKRLQREDMLAAEAAAAEAAGGTGGRDSDSGDSSGSSDGGGGAGGRRGRRVVPSIRQLLHDLQRDWAQHVTIVQVDVAKTFGDACVASLACIFAGSSAAGTAAIGGSSGSGRTDGSSSLVLASDFLGSVTVMRLVANSRGAALISCGPDRHPIFAQAAAWLDPEHALVAVHPHGLVVLRRDPKAEEDAMRVALEKAVADFEAGMARRRRYQDVAQVWEAAGAGQARQHAGAKPGGGAPAAAAAANQESRFSLEDLHLLKPQMEATPGLTMNAACRVRHMVTRMCRARLGMRPQPHRHHDHQQPSRHSSASTPSTSRTSTPAISAHGKALPGTGQGVGAPFHHQQWDASDLLLCFSVSGYVAAVRLQHQGPAAAAVPALPPLPPLAKLARLQHAVASLDPVDMALLTGIDSDSYGHSYSWPLVVPRETAAGAGLAGGGSSAVADEAGRRRGTPPLSASAGTSGAGGGGRSTQMQVDGVEEEFMALEAEAEALAAGCVDGSVMRVLLAAAEAQLRKDGESEAVASASVAGGRVGSAGGGGRVAAVLRRLAREVTGAADLGALVGLLQRSSLAGINL